ncbi:hypothetical protein EVU96_24370 [Bacillus infantis]|uniref:hypothetical protein n=1 Tax=Bacillus infantis TaxID=324767 RepID=UPI00101D4E49|nr:hypothetical protein [Bacillus infantis]RYI25285.1 hypothetical protein EVU96_24370 [Bacillus infantis]
MAAPQNKIKLAIVILLAFFVQMAVLQPALADVSEVETGPQGLSETKEDDATSGEPVKGDADLPWWKKALNELGDIKDGAIDGLKEFGDWAVDEWNDFTDYAGKKFNDFTDYASKKFDEFGDWAGNVWNDIENFFAENKWAQTIVAAIAATAIIVGAIAILVVTGVVSVPILVVAAIVGAGALAGGFLYQWLAGDGYNFWGAFGSSLVGGILAYAGYASGAFAAGWAWLRHTAGPAAWNWARNTAWPWIAGRGQAAWRWMRHTAWPWLRGKGAAAWRWFKMRPIWGQLRGFYTASGIFARIKMGALLGALGGSVSSAVGTLLSGDPFNIYKFAADTLVGAFSGALLGPIALSGQALSWSIVGFTGLYGGIENFLVSGFKDGEWSAENFLVGLGVSIISAKVISVLVERSLSTVSNQFLEEGVTKTGEELVKKGYEEIKEEINNNENKSKDKQGQDTSPETSDKSEQNRSSEEKKGTEEKPEENSNNVREDNSYKEKQSYTPTKPEHGY